MFHPDRRTFPLRVGIAVVCGLLLLGVVTESRAATDAQCSSAYNESDASDQCTTVSVSARSGNRCKIVASCPSGTGASQQDSIYVPLDVADELKNCGGWLTLGSC